MTTPPFEACSTYVHLNGGRAEPMPVDGHFWSDLASGARPLPGWLVAEFEWPADAVGSAGAHSEMHPNGDEVHVCLSGAMTVVLETNQGEERIDFSAGRACIVERGVWHRLVAREASRVLSFTFGEGSQHRGAS